VRFLTEEGIEISIPFFVDFYFIISYNYVMKKIFEKFWSKIKLFLKFIFNWRFALSFGIAWMITNGWAYICLGIGLWFDIKWLAGIAGSYTAILYLPFTAEKLITIPLAILICKILFPKQKKVQDQLNELLEKEKGELNEIRVRKRKNKKQLPKS
jgi:hypothetical protein